MLLLLVLIWLQTTATAVVDCDDLKVVERRLFQDNGILVTDPAVRSYKTKNPLIDLPKEKHRHVFSKVEGEN